jgi:hypothetical protein
VRSRQAFMQRISDWTSENVTITYPDGSTNHSQQASPEANMTGWYNGYSKEQRNAKSAARKILTRQGKFGGYPPGPCSICADPDVETEPHSEDYSYPYSWREPAVYSLCRTCHRTKLHKRFSHPLEWTTWKAHVRRGGRSSDLKDPNIVKELKRYKRLHEAGQNPTLDRIRKRRFPRKPWWENVTLEQRSLTDPTFRPRRLGYPETPEGMRSVVQSYRTGQQKR